MTDLLDQLADVNPVPGCDKPSIDDVWRRLDAVGDPVAADARPRRSGLVARGLRAAPALVAVAVCLAVVIVAVTGPRSSQTRVGVDGASRPGWNATDGQRPSLSALMAHFAVLRRSPTAADRPAVRRFGVGIGTAGQTEQPTFVRLAGEANGIPVYFVVYADYRHGATGPVSGYSLQIISGGGASYAAGSYMIFPTVTTSDSGTRSAYLSVVPDGVRMVRWRLACQSNVRGCVLPAGQHTLSAPVRDNLAVVPLRTPNPGTAYAGAVSVTWYRDDGTQATFTNENAAVPFAGAPAWPAGRGQSPQRYAPGNGPQAGESLGHWRSLYSVLGRPQSDLDRHANAKAAAATSAPFVRNLTRVALDTGHTLVFVTLSAANPGAPPAHRRYVAEVWSAGLGPGQGTTSQPLVTGVQPPISAPGPTALEYSVVPDDVTKVSWQFKCSAGCDHLSRSPRVIAAHDNVVSTTVTAGSWSVGHVTWYLRGGDAPLRLGS